VEPQLSGDLASRATLSQAPPELRPDQPIPAPRAICDGSEGKAETGSKIGFLRLVALLIPCALITVIDRRLIQISQPHLAPSPEAALAASMRTPVL